MKPRTTPDRGIVDTAKRRRNIKVAPPACPYQKNTHDLLDQPAQNDPWTGERLIGRRLETEVFCTVLESV